MALFRALWIGTALSSLERLCIQSFLAHGHAFELFVYHPVANVPTPCRQLDAREILPESYVFANQEREGKGSYAAFSDLFRYKLLFDRGGWWVDTDVVCLSSVVPEPVIALARQDAGQVNGAILRFPAGYPAMQFAYETAAAAGQSFRWGHIGPDLLTAIVRRFDLERWLVPTQSYYPIYWREFAVVLQPSTREYVAAKISGATFLHLWNEMFQRVGYNKNCLPPAGSYLRELFDRYALSDGFEFEYRMAGAGGNVRLEKHKVDSPPGPAA
jgi:hypothetical protein